MTEREYFDMVEAVRESLFPSLPKAEFQKTALHNRNVIRAFPPSFNDSTETTIAEGLPPPIIVTKTLPF